MLREQLLQGKSVLIVEDNGTMSGVVAMMVRWLGGRQIEIASTFDNALSCCELNRYDVLLLDIQLDGNRDGIALAKAIKSRGWDNDALLIFVTGSISRTCVDAALSVAPDGYIAKPLSASTLATVIYKATMKRERQIGKPGADLVDAAKNDDPGEAGSEADTGPVTRAGEAERTADDAAAVDAESEVAEENAGA